MAGRGLIGAGLYITLVGTAMAGIALGLTRSSAGSAPAPVGEPHACDGTVSEIVSVGDILLGDYAQKRLDKQGYDFPFRHLGPLLADADLVMGNLEAPITTHDEKYVEGKKWSYRQDPRAASALRNAGFGLLALANNHTLDFGPQGLADTLDHFSEQGILPLGGGRDESSARQGQVIELPGGTVGLLAYMEPYGNYEKDGWFAAGDAPGCAKMEFEIMQADIARMRELADVVIVHCHFGRNYAPPTRYQQRMAKAVIDMGADAVNGHHSHVAQGIEIYKGKPILYSLGNFTFGTPGCFVKIPGPGYGMVARYRICDGTIANVAVQLINVDNKKVRYRPRPTPAEEARPAMEELVAPYGTPLVWEGATAVIELPGHD